MPQECIATLFSHQFFRVFFDLVKRCLEVDPKNRISAMQALEHDYFMHLISSILTAFIPCFHEWVLLSDTPRAATAWNIFFAFAYWTFSCIIIINIIINSMITANFHWVTIIIAHSHPTHLRDQNAVEMRCPGKFKRATGSMKCIA